MIDEFMYIRNINPIISMKYHIILYIPTDHTSKLVHQLIEPLLYIIRDSGISLLFTVALNQCYRNRLTERSILELKSV